MRILTARLSARRRSPLAGLVVLLLGLLATGGLYSVLSPANASSEASDTEIVAKGRELFLVGCSTCHGLNAEGVGAKGDTQYGPPLVGVGAAAVDFQVSTGRMPMARPGPQAPVKPSVYNAGEVEALAAYIASLGPGPAIPEEADYNPDEIPQDERDEALARGGEFFRTNCTACHNFTGAGGALPGGKWAPKLTGVSSKHIYEAMLTGPQQMPVFSDEVLKPEEKREIIAYLVSLQEGADYGGAGLGAFGPVSEGLFAWIVGIGGCVAFAIWIAAAGTRSTKKGAGQ